jgi:signal transduction histidine kinase
MRPRPVRWPWLVVLGFIALAVVGSVLVVENGESMVDQVPFIIAFAMFGIVGALITSRARNRIGALLLWGSGMTAASFVAGEFVTYWVRQGITEGPAVVGAALLSNLGWVIGILPVLFLIPQVFPDGHVLSRRWLPLAWATMITLGLVGLFVLFGSEKLTGSVTSAEVDNPFYVPAVGAVQITDGFFTLFLLGSLVGGVTSLIVRFRRARGVERQQIKWVVASIVFVVLTLAVSAIFEAFGETSFLVDTVLSGLGFLSIPVAIGVGVLQYRLFELDIVVTKALIAGTLALVVIGAYAALVWLFGAVASGRESSASLFVLALLLGIAFRPVTRFARKVADRLVYGRRATPYEVLTEFSERVGGSYATEDVLGRMVTILGEGVGAAAARVWLHVGDELRPASSWPAGAQTVSTLRVTGDAVPEISGETAVEVRDGRELLGALSVLMPANDPMTPGKERLVRDLASQAGLVLRNVRLVEELRASQRRIVAAQDQERRRLERNIHDGAQQQLVALTVKMRLAQSFAGNDVAKTEEMLAQMQEDTQAALEDLRDLARGIYPPLLADKGLAAALEAQIRKTAVPVELAPDGVTRYPAEIEAAVYFSVLEALQNVAKYAGATRTAVHLGEADGWLTFAVEDDGRGFDPDAVDRGMGLQGIADRVSALDGELEVRSRLGEGTMVRGRIPVVADTPGGGNPP